MDSDKPFDLDGGNNQTPQDTEKEVKEIEKKMIDSCKKHIENSDSTEKLPFLERIKHKLENSLHMCEEKLNKIRNKNMIMNLSQQRLKIKQSKSLILSKRE